MGNTLDESEDTEMGVLCKPSYMYIDTVLCISHNLHVLIFIVDTVLYITHVLTLTVDTVHVHVPVV